VRRRSLGARLRDDDATLVARMQAGDERAFAAIFKRHHGPLLSYCRHMLGNRDEGEDALQQAFIKAHQALLGGTEPRELRPWLYAIARNCCLSAIAARRPTTPLEEHTPTLAGLSDEVRQREDLRELLAAIGRLPEDQRSALLLAELDDLSHQAIATVVGCPVNKVKALVYQARSALIADRDARDTPCQDIREQLSIARDGELRRGPLRRHLNLCSGCHDFQLAVNAQRQSLAAVLPVLPSAGLAAAILGHGTAHVAGAASIGGAGTGMAPAGGAAGTGVGVTATATTATGTTAGATATGATTAGSGVAAGTTAASTAVGAGAGAGGGASVGALVGGGMITKLAVGGAVVALATAGAVAARHRPTQAISSRAARGRLASFATRASDVIDIADTNDGPDGSPESESPTPLTAASDPASVASPELATGLTSSGAATPLLTLTGMSPPGPVLADISGLPTTAGLPAGSAGQAGSSQVSSPVARKTRAKLRRVALRRRARRLRKAQRRARLRAARLRAALRKALRHRRHPAAPKPPKSPKTPASPVAPAPVRAHHRKAHPAPSPLGSQTASTTEGEGSESKESTGTKGKHHRAGADSGSTSATSTAPETSTTSTGKAKRKIGSGTGTEKSGAASGTGKVGSGTVTEKSGAASGTGKAGSGSATGKAGSDAATEKSSSGAAGKETGSGANTGKTGTEAATGAGSPSSAGDATESSDTAAHTSETTAAGARSRRGVTPPPKKLLVEEAQLPNL
jgi:RNA polymerase sigma factor (sigma-70 family)